VSAAESVRIAADGEPTGDEPFALELGEFISLQLEPPTPLIGDSRNTILPVGGLGIVAGKEGIGKTTLMVDLAFHLASGQDWLGFKIPQPASVLIVENEGPQHAFRVKLQQKLAVWEPLMPAPIYVQTWSWGGLSFRDKEAHAHAREFLETHELDVVIGDPLDSLGDEGVVSPEDVRKFVDILVPLGLKTTRAFILLTHFRREAAQEEIDQVSGVWARPADAFITIKKMHSPDQLRVNPSKLRHARDTLKPVIVGLVRELGGFERLGEEGDARLLEDELVAVLTEWGEKRPVGTGPESPWRTIAELAEKGKGGIGCRRADVQACLEGNAHLFTAVKGPEVGRSAKAVGWQLASNIALRPEATIAPETDEEADMVSELWEAADDVSGGRDGSTRGDTGEEDPWQ